MTERHITKTVETIAKDDDEQVAISAVLVPNEVDRQLDFLRPRGVRNLFNPNADIGVMHAVFDNSAATSEHRILEEPETIGGEEYAAGTWIERREYHDDELWALVKDGVLEGRSIGGQVPEESEVEHAPGDVPDDVVFPAGVPSDRGATEIVDGSVSEVSDVDVPAVPNAEHAVVKSDIAKDILGDVADEAEFVQVMSERGHSEEDARRLFRYMTSVGKTAKDADMSVPQSAANAAERAFAAREEHGNPNGCLTGQGWARARQLRDNDQIDADAWREIRAFFRRSQEQEGRAYDADTHEPPDCAWYEWHVWGGQAAWDKAERVVEQLDQTVNEPAESGVDESKHDAMTNSDTDDTDESGGKSLDNVDDATLGQRVKSALGLGSGADDDGNSSEDSGNTDAEKAGRTLSERNQRAVMAAVDAQLDMLDDAGVDHGMTRFSDRDDVEFDLAQYGRKPDMDDKNAADGDTPDDSNMTDDTDTTDDTEKSEVPAWAENLAEKVESIEKRVDEMDDDEAEKGLDDAPEWASELAEKVDGLDDRVDAVAKGAADTDQIEGSDGGETHDETSAFKAALGGN